MCHNFFEACAPYFCGIGHVPQLFVAYVMSPNFEACATTFRSMCHSFSRHVPQLFGACATTFCGMSHNFSGHVPQLFCGMCHNFEACATTFRSMCHNFTRHVPQLFGPFVARALHFVAYAPLFVARIPYFMAYWSLPLLRKSVKKSRNKQSVYFCRRAQTAIAF